MGVGVSYQSGHFTATGLIIMMIISILTEAHYQTICFLWKRLCFFFMGNVARRRGLNLRLPGYEAGALTIGRMTIWRIVTGSAAVAYKPASCNCKCALTNDMNCLKLNQSVQNVWREQTWSQGICWMFDLGTWSWRIFFTQSFGIYQHYSNLWNETLQMACTSISFVILIILCFTCFWTHCLLLTAAFPRLWTAADRRIFQWRWTEMTNDGLSLSINHDGKLNPSPSLLWHSYLTPY